MRLSIFLSILLCAYCQQNMFYIERYKMVQFFGPSGAQIFDYLANFNADWIYQNNMWHNKNGLTYNGEYTTNKHPFEPYGQGTLILNEKKLIGHWNGWNFIRGNLIINNKLTYDGDWQNNQLHGYGKYYGDDWNYEGNFANNKFNGQGTYRSSTGTHTGNFKDGEEYGYGVTINSKGDKYEGEWNGPYLIGKCKIKLRQGYYMEGMCNKNIPTDGHVIMYSHLGSYDGNFKNGLMHGHGKYIHSSGYTYNGYFQDGKRSGRGKIIFTDGVVYDGDWLDDNIHGFGKFIASNGNIYEGKFQMNKRHGYGQSSDTLGNTYKGNWLDDIKHGDGELFSKSDNTISNGKFENDILVYGQVKTGNNIFEGHWKDGLLEGEGHAIIKDSNIIEYHGSYKAGVFDGYGKLELNGKIFYEGLWCNGKQCPNDNKIKDDDIEKGPCGRIVRYKSKPNTYINRITAIEYHIENNNDDCTNVINGLRNRIENTQAVEKWAETIIGVMTSLSVPEKELLEALTKTSLAKAINFIQSILKTKGYLNTKKVFIATWAAYKILSKNSIGQAPNNAMLLDVTVFPAKGVAGAPGNHLDNSVGLHLFVDGELAGSMGSSRHNFHSGFFIKTKKSNNQNEDDISHWSPESAELVEYKFK